MPHVRHSVGNKFQNSGILEFLFILVLVRENSHSFAQSTSNPLFCILRWLATAPTNVPPEFNGSKVEYHLPCSKCVPDVSKNSVTPKNAMQMKPPRKRHVPKHCWPSNDRGCAVWLLIWVI